jgi:hypothetical protein
MAEAMACLLWRGRASVDANAQGSNTDVEIARALHDIGYDCRRSTQPQAGQKTALALKGIVSPLS